MTFRLFCQFDTQRFVKIASSMNERLFSFLNPLPYKQIRLVFLLSFSVFGVFGPQGSGSVIIRMDPDLDPAPDPSTVSTIKKMYKNLDFNCFVTSYRLDIFEE